MSEKRLAIDGLELNYKGLFDIHDLLKEIDKVTSAKGYVKEEKRRAETVRPEGKEFSMELRPIKQKTEYEALMIKMRINITNMKDVEVVMDNVKTKLNEGNINIIFDAWTTTDYEFRWEKKPLYWLLRNIFDRVIYKFHIDKYMSELIDDCHFIHNNIKSHLELHHFV